MSIVSGMVTVKIRRRLGLSLVPSNGEFPFFWEGELKEGDGSCEAALGTPEGHLSR